MAVKIDEPTLRGVNGVGPLDASRFNEFSYDSFIKHSSAPREYICEKLVRARAVTLLVSFAGIGKSRFGYCLAAARAPKPEGGNVLAGLKVKPGRTALFSLEHSADTINWGLEAARRGRKLKSMDHVIVYRGRPEMMNILDLAFRTELTLRLDDTGVDLILFDSARCIPGFKSSNDDNEVHRVMEALAALGNDKRAVVAYYHTPRGDRNRPRGSGAWEANADEAFAITDQGGLLSFTPAVEHSSKTEGGIFMQPVHGGQFGDKDSTLTMQYVDGTDLTSTQQNEEEQLKGILMEYMGQHPEGVSARDLVAVSGKRYAAVCTAMSELARDGSIVKGKGKKPWTRA